MLQSSKDLIKIDDLGAKTPKGFEVEAQRRFGRLKFITFLTLKKKEVLL